MAYTIGGRTYSTRSTVPPSQGPDPYAGQYTAPYQPRTSSLPYEPFGGGAGGGTPYPLAPIGPSGGGTNLYTRAPTTAAGGAVFNNLGPQLRASILRASPELATAANYLQTAFHDPFGGQLQTFQESIRSAQGARGFEGGGTGLVGEEARYLTNFAERRRGELLPQLVGLGQSILDISAQQQQGIQSQDLFTRYLRTLADPFASMRTTSQYGNYLTSLGGFTGSNSLYGQLYSNPGRPGGIIPGVGNYGLV